MDESGQMNAAGASAAAGPPHPLGFGFGDTLRDMRFVGWVGLIYGILVCLSIVGAIVGVPLIIAAHRFIEGTNRFENYRQDRSESELKAGFAELGRSFRVLKILVIVYIVLMVCVVAFTFLLGGLGLLAELANS